MANIFAISNPTETIKSDANGKASAVFTVTNNSGKEIRGAARAKPTGNTKPEWLSIEGDSERNFPVNGTQQYMVSFSRPMPAAPSPAEKYQFRLDVASTENPDEDFTEGMVVTVEIPEQKVPEQKKPFPWWIVVVGGTVLLLIIGLLVWFLLRPGKVNGGPPVTPTPRITPSPSPSGPQEVYNFYDSAPSARWTNDTGKALDGTQQAPDGGMVQEPTGFMENGQNEQKVLFTHPRWEVGGTIKGDYTLPGPIKRGDRFRARIGFKAGAAAGNLKLRVMVNGTVIEEIPKIYDGTLREVIIRLDSFESQSGNMSLQALAIPHSGQGWICWVNPRIERE